MLATAQLQINLCSPGAYGLRRYGTQFKAMVLEQCDKPGASLAQVAMSHRINDNVVHRWRRMAPERDATQPAVAASASAQQQPAQFVSLARPAPVGGDVKADIRVEVKRAAVTMSLAWPEHALGHLAGLVRELLKCCAGRSCPMVSASRRCGLAASTPSHA